MRLGSERSTTVSRQIRAGPVMEPASRIDSKVALRRRDQGEDEEGGLKGSIEVGVAPEREESMVDCRPGWLIISRIVEVKVAWRFTRPPQTTIATRSEGW